MSKKSKKQHASLDADEVPATVLDEAPADLAQLWQKAVSFAARSHRGQLRKDGKTPYIAHPFRVALTVRDLFQEADAVALCSALLHDVIEDTAVDYDQVEREFGPEVAQAVACLTKDKRLPESEREPAFYEQIARGEWQVRLVKLADAYDNLCDTATQPPTSKALEKARWAVKAAGVDSRLARAVAILSGLIAAKAMRPGTSSIHD